MASDIKEVKAKGKVETKAAVKGENGAPDQAAEYQEVSTTVQYDIPGSLDGMIAKFGNEVVASQAQAALVISLQAFVRRHLGKPQAELQKLVDAWKPETRAAVSRKSAAEKIEENIGGLDAEAKKALIEKLKASLKG